jgi:hypothetical protein
VGQDEQDAHTVEEQSWVSAAPAVLNDCTLGIKRGQAHLKKLRCFGRSDAGYGVTRYNLDETRAHRDVVALDFLRLIVLQLST